MKLKIDGAAGRAAIYTGSDDAPLTNPRSNFGRLKFHSDLEYVRVVEVHTGTLSLQARAKNRRTLVTHSGPEHDRPGAPLVFGTLVLQGERIAFAGSIPVQATAQASRFITFGASATRILFHEQSNCSDRGSLPEFSLTYTIFITDQVLS